MFLGRAPDIELRLANAHPSNAVEQAATLREHLGDGQVAAVYGAPPDLRRECQRLGLRVSESEVILEGSGRVVLVGKEDPQEVLASMNDSLAALGLAPLRGDEAGLHPTIRAGRQ